MNIEEALVILDTFIEHGLSDVQDHRSLEVDDRYKLDDHLPE